MAQAKKESAPVDIAATEAVVTRQYLQNSQVTTEATKNETIKVHQYVTPPGRVEVGMGLTINLGNFETARIDVRISTPCYREEIDAAYDYAHSWVERRIQTEVEGIRANKPALY